MSARRAKTTPDHAANVSLEKANLSVEDIELESLFFTIGKDRSSLQLKKLTNEVKRELDSIFSRSAWFQTTNRREEQSRVFSNLTNKVNALFEQWENQRSFHVPGVGKEKDFF